MRMLQQVEDCKLTRLQTKSNSRYGEENVESYL